MRVTVDRTLCQGHALCNTFAPDVYDLDDDGRCVPLDEPVPVELEAQAADGLNVCPERAISAED